jgi:hypothetical protein
MHTHYVPAFRTTRTPAETQVSSPLDGVHRAPKRTADKRATDTRTTRVTSAVGRKAARHHLRDATPRHGDEWDLFFFRSIDYPAACAAKTLLPSWWQCR